MIFYLTTCASRACAGLKLLWLFSSSIPLLEASACNAMARLLALLPLLLAVAGCSGQEEILRVAFDQSDVYELTVSARCCPLDANPIGTCNEEDCPAAATEQLELATTDGDALTEWIVDFVSEISPNGPVAEITFNLGQVS